MEKRRVVVTGMGVVSPLGNTPDVLWNELLNGRSGISFIEQYDTATLPVKIAGTIKAFDVSPYLSAKEARKVDPFICYALAASTEAIHNARLDPKEIDLFRAGCCIGSGIGGISTIESQHQTFLSKGPRRVSPFFITGSISNMAAGFVSIQFGFKGPNYSVVTACSSGTHNIGIAARMIRYGETDVMLAGGAEKGSCALGMSAFAAARALSKNEHPEQASRPWDRQRDGFVLSDGAGVLVLEAYEHARQRGAPILAEVVGFGASSDAYHITAPDSEGSGAAHAMRMAIADAGVAADEIDYINAHGTSTPLGDVAEIIAIKNVFQKAAHKVAISSTKSMLGHMLGAAGAVEAIISILTLQNQVVPPTINLEEPDDQCDLDLVPNHPRNTPVEMVMSNSFGFGGTNGSLLLRKCI